MKKAGKKCYIQKFSSYYYYSQKHSHSSSFVFISHYRKRKERHHCLSFLHFSIYAISFTSHYPSI